MHTVMCAPEKLSNHSPKFQNLRWKSTKRENRSAASVIEPSKLLAAVNVNVSTMKMPFQSSIERHEGRRAQNDQQCHSSQLHTDTLLIGATVTVTATDPDPVRPPYYPPSDLEYRTTCIDQTVVEGQFDDFPSDESNNGGNDHERGTDDEIASHTSLLTQETDNDPPPEHQCCCTPEYDESYRNFFLAEPVSNAEVAATEESIYENMDQVLRKFERGGADEYEEYLQDLQSQNDDEVQSESQTATEQALEEATIRGFTRDYQIALFEIAKTRNTIIHLGTGKGKTLIALLCIKHFAKAFNQKKQTLFMVPSVALALQQSTALRANLPYSVETACFNVAHSAQSRVKLSRANIVVATHGAIHDLLMHYSDLFSFSNFNLVVLDECHYAHGSHQYKIIMDKWYHTLPKEKRPHILGLTASPLTNVKHTHSNEQLSHMLTSLEQTLDSQLVTLKGTEDDTQQLLGKEATERQVAFVGAPEPNGFPSHDDLNIHHRRPRELNQLRILYQDLGPLVVSLYVKSVVKEISCNVYEKETTEQFHCLVAHLRSIVKYCTQQTNRRSGGRTDKLLKLEELLQQQLDGRGDSVGLVFVQRRITAMALYTYFSRQEEDIDDWNSVQGSSMSNPSPKNPFSVAKGTLLDQFEDADTDPAKEHIEFTSKRPQHDHGNQFADADEVSDAIPFEWQEVQHTKPVPGQFCDAEESTVCVLPNTIRCGVLVRQATQIFKYLNASNHISLEDETVGSDIDKSWLHQEMRIRETLCALRKKEINVLLATSIVEEGVDVQACSFVVVFDSANSVKAYVQMKGRARQKDAGFFLFCEDGDESNSPALENLQKSEKRIHAFIKQRQDRTVFDIPIAMPYTRPESNPSLSAELRAVEEQEYRARHGAVDLKSAKSLLNRYVLNIPIESTARATKEAFLLHMPKFGENELVLPAHLPLDVRLVTVPQQYRALKKAEKHQILALMACVRLHKLKLLNERLLPLGKKDLTQEILRVATNQTAKTTPYAVSISTLFAGGEREVFLYPIVQRGDKLSKVHGVLKGDSKSLVLVSCERISVEIDSSVYHHQQLGEVHCELGEEIPTTFDELQWDITTKFFSVLFGARWRKKTRDEWFQGREKTQRQEVLAPHVVGLLTKEGRLDWNAMELLVRESGRQSCERDSACQLYDTTRQMPAPRLCNPTHHKHVTYVVLGPTSLDCSAPFPDKLDGGVETFHDYYRVKYDCEVPSNDKLFVAQRLWYQPSNYQECAPDPGDWVPPPGDQHSLPEGSADGIDTCPGLVTVLLPQTLCREAELADPSLLLLSAVLPQLLYALERRLVVQSFTRHCSVNFPCLGEYVEELPWTDLSVAMTAKSANLDVDYDQYEWFGDAVLKLLQSDALLCTPELRCWVNHLHEGDLTTLRSAMGNNEYLAVACQRVGFDKFVFTVPLARGKWVPRHLKLCSGYHDQVETRSEAQPSMKVCADIMESLLGLIHIHFGYRAATSVGLECGVLLPQGTGVNLNDFIQSNVVPRPTVYDAARRMTGRAHFDCPGLVTEAFTHPSAVHEAVPSYQKLEWVGDAVLCIAVREWIFRTFPSLPVGDMVTLDAAMVSNEVLGYQCFKTGLHKMINHRDQSLPSRLEHYKWSIEEGGRAVWGSDPPKMLPDVVEALIGAAHIDGGYEAGQIAVTTMMGPILEAIRSLEGDASKLSHPISKLNHIGGHLLQVDVQREDAFLRNHGRDAHVWQGIRWREASIDGTESTGTVNSLGHNIISVADSSWKSARNRACALAVAVLEKHPKMVQRWKEVTMIIDRHSASKQPKEGLNVRLSE